MYLQIRSVLRVAACLVLAGGGGSHCSQGRQWLGFIQPPSSHLQSAIRHTGGARYYTLWLYFFAHYLLIIVADTLY